MNDSRWYYGVIAVMALEIVGFGLIGVTNVVTEQVLFEVDALVVGTGLVGAGLVVVSFLLLPVFALCLFLDARAVRNANESWDPSPALWAVGGAVLQIVALIGGTTLYFVIGTFYLFRRFRSSPAAVADEDVWAEQEAAWAEEEGADDD